MAYLRSFREGWRTEHLARFILSKFAFMSEPIAVSDDIGSDFICTLFDIKDKKYLFPKNSFAIQIKSKGEIMGCKNIIEMTNKIDYLNGLELPFFVGVGDKDSLKLEIYSSEAIPQFFSHKGLPQKLEIELCDSFTGTSHYTSNENKDGYILKFPKVTELSINLDDEDDVSRKIKEMETTCNLVQRSIASRITKEYMFMYKEEKDKVKVNIVGGVDSYNACRDNLFRRLYAIFYNIHWAIKKTKDFSSLKKEFDFYKEIYNNSRNIYDRPPTIISIQDYDRLISDIDVKLNPKNHA